MQERLKEILDNHSKSIEEAAKEIISELKVKANTYKDLEREINKFDQETRWKYAVGQEFGFLLKEIRRIVAEEKDNLPIRNDTRAITIKLDTEQFQRDIKSIIETLEETRRLERKGIPITFPIT